LIDTAGIRDNAEEIEAMGIERSREKIIQAKIVLCMADSSVPNSIEEVLNWAKEIHSTHPDKKIVIVANKQDISVNSIEFSEKVIFISAKEGVVIGDFSLSDETIVSNIRHYDALIKTATSLQKAKDNLATGITADFVAMDIRQAMFDLGTITGDISTDDLLGNIFSKFCIGK
jgi:tRNA modification GTPase